MTAVWGGACRLLGWLWFGEDPDGFGSVKTLSIEGLDGTESNNAETKRDYRARNSKPESNNAETGIGQYSEFETVQVAALACSCQDVDR